MRFNLEILYRVVGLSRPTSCPAETTYAILQRVTGKYYEIFQRSFESYPSVEQPAYDEQGPQGSTDWNNASHPDFVTVPTNFVAINEENSIRDNYTIDTSLQPIHMNFDLGSAIPQHRDEVRHLALRSGNGYIQTKIRLIGSNRETAMLVLETQYRNIYVSVGLCRRLRIEHKT